jgi:hypothetical protein
MPTVVAIHNTVNERAWHEVLQWEALHAGSCPTPRLKRFQGRPADFSPKARLLNFLVRGSCKGRLAGWLVAGWLALAGWLAAAARGAS